jgi:hypothetical protein
MSKPRLCALLLALTFASAAHAGPEDGSVPAENTSHVSADAPAVTAIFLRADEAIAAGDWREAVRVLQGVIDAAADPDDAGAAYPHVLPVFGSVVYEGAWIVARHRILAGGAPALEAYEAEFGPVAGTLLQAGVQRRDPALLAAVVDRFLPLAAGRRAALLCADLALESGDTDAALGWLERLEDLEEVSAEPAQALAPWRAARIERTAAALARPDRRAAVKAFLETRARPGLPESERYQPVPAADRRPRAPATGWPTTGGGPRRDARAPGLGARLELAWWLPLEGGVEPPDPEDDVPRARPSPWIPSRAVVDGTLAFVSDGARLEVWDLERGRHLARPHALLNEQEDGLSRVDEVDAREDLGLLEGFSLSLGPTLPHGGRIVYVAVPDPVAGRSYWAYGDWRDDRIEAFEFDPTAHTLTLLWRNGGYRPRGGLPPQTRLYGAPLLYRDRLWVAGVRPSRGTEHEADAWLFGLSPTTGDVEVRTYLGSGAPVRGGRPDEAIPSSPAGAHGRVVVFTGLGIVASVDARTGRPHWAYRNDRGVVGAGRLKRLQGERDRTPRETGFANVPPLIAFERIWVAPTDGLEILCLFDRPRGPRRALRAWRKDRRAGFVDFAAEQIVGLTTPAHGAPLLVVVGRGEVPEGRPPAALAKAIDAFDPAGRWEAFATTGDGPAPYGTALLTEEELFVPTRHGICVFDLLDGSDLATLDVASVPAALRDLLTPGIGLGGNLVPAPGLGLLVLSGTHGVFWRVPPR